MITVYYSLASSNVLKVERAPGALGYYYASAKGWVYEPLLMKKIAEGDAEECSIDAARKILSRNFPGVDFKL